MYSRQCQRKPLVLYLDVLALPSHELLGHLGDISARGMMFVALQTFQVGDTLEIAIRLPQNDEFNQLCIKATIQVRWIQPNLNPRLSCIGCEFLQLDPTDLPLIQKIGDFIGFDASVDVHRVACHPTEEECVVNSEK
ncbi:PilZ domain-containing protein [Thioflexithrix psekupsensis]|uniref:PilZ domain-containing protein n=1 Tax=Thioflexithrix psekupsensis TaxID=1570016 RepID=A0A251X6G9_9GAMM|nr:PilZ domain-containing protein [Thioflexithrix psekupsensis]OUD13336.1 hypothetical protein TPSD3_11995 [Thioflexithrix psekupsensis]